MSYVLDISQDELRDKILGIAKQHKASWVELGQYLYSIQKDKLYKYWGFLGFDIYCRKELNLKEATAQKMLKSYLYLEKEEPRMARPEYTDEQSPKQIPNFESVNLLRLAKHNKNIESKDFAQLREAVLEAGEEPKDVRAKVKKLLSEREIKDPSEVRRLRRNAVIKRLVTTLANTKQELEGQKLLPSPLLKQIAELSEKLADQIE